jgi:predicted nucleotidyltransferase
VVVGALRRWAEACPRDHPEVLRIGYLGSYARGDWGVGSDLDVLLVLEVSDRPFIERPSQWDLSDIPVPVDVLVYTRDEWEAMAREGSKFHQVAEREVVWVYSRFG